MLLALSKQALFKRAWLVRYRLFYDPPIFYPPIQILYELIHIHKHRIEIYRYKNYENVKLSALLQKHKNTRYTKVKKIPSEMEVAPRYNC